MGEAMTSKPEPDGEHDDAGPGIITHYPVPDIEGLAKAVIREAPDKAYRWLMWEAFSSAMEDAKAASTEYPWDDPQSLTSITPESARAALLKMFDAIPGDAERDRLAAVAAREAEIMEARLESGIPDSGVPDGKHPLRHCAQCGRRFSPKRPSAKWCSPSCRTANWKQKQAAAKR